MIGIGGIAMGTLAAMLKEKGFHVLGSDQNLYPPMSINLERLQIPVHLGYCEENLYDISPDFVVIGNAIRRDNPEAQFVLEKDLPYLSMPEAIERFFLSTQKSIVVAGTHGKSTTASILAWILYHAQRDPSAFIGAFVKNWESSYRIGNGKHIIIEGDEYDTAFFDKGPKFLHYKPSIGIITSIEYDHADIFPNYDAVLGAFTKFVHLFDNDKQLIVNADDPNCLSLAHKSVGTIITYGESPEADWQLLDVCYQPGEIKFRYRDPSFKQHEMITRLAGHHNLCNTLAVIAAASIVDIPVEQIQEAILAFQGVKRRQDIIGESNGILIIDDFAHHPTAVLETVSALRLHFPDRRMIAAFEPRTNSSRRNVFQRAYATAFGGAHCVCIKQPPDMDKIPESERLDVKELMKDIRNRNEEAYYFENTDELITFLKGYCRFGDLVLCMSNGSFDGLPNRLLTAIQTVK